MIGRFVLSERREDPRQFEGRLSLAKSTLACQIDVGDGTVNKVAAVENGSVLFGKLTLACQVVAGDCTVNKVAAVVSGSVLCVIIVVGVCESALPSRLSGIVKTTMGTF